MMNDEKSDSLVAAIFGAPASIPWAPRGIETGQVHAI
jgi:hypothetical protein